MPTQHVPASPGRPYDQVMIATPERKARALRPTVYCPPAEVEECIREAAEVE